MGALESLIKDYEKIISERDAAEMRFFKFSNEASELKTLLKKINKSIISLREHNELTKKQGIVRGSFWKAVNDVLILEEEIKELLEPQE